MAALAPSRTMWGSREAHTSAVAADSSMTRTAAEEAAGVPALPPPPHRLAAPLQRRDPDRYELLGEHGRGGLGTVTRAHDKELGRNVAIKELIKRGDSGEIRFLREAMITARLEHPGIVPVHEAGQWPDGTPFYVMKLVAGRSLKEVIASRAVGDRMALLHHVVAVADAVAYAHKRRIIHRDLKPANVIVGDFGETVVIDWGLAKDLSELDGDSPADDRSPYRAPVVDDLTQIGSVLGTPMYMAPEQWRGERVDQRADVFAIGAMLWELCSKHRVPPAEPRKRDQLLRRASIDADLIAIIGKALAGDPAQRYQNAGELASDLRAFTSGARIASRRYSLAGVAVHWIRHHRAIAAIATTALVLGVIGATVYVRNVGVARDRAEYANGELVLQNADLLMQRDPTAVVDALTSYRGADKVRKDRLLAEAHGRGVAEARFSPHGDTVHFLHRAADGSVFSLGEDRRLVVTKTGASTTLATDVSPSIAHDFSPATQLLGYGTSPFGVTVFDLKARTATRVGEMHAAALEISNDGSLLAVLDTKSELTVWRLPGRQLIRREVVADAIGLSLGDTALMIIGKSAVQAIDFASASPTTATRTADIAAFDTRGDEIALGTAQGTITLLDLGLKPRGVVAACRQAVTTLRLASAHRIAFGCQDGLAGVARFDPATASLTIELSVATTGPVTQTTIDSEARRMVSIVAPAQILVSDLETKLTRTLRGHPAVITSLSVPADDRILTGDGDGNIRVWRLPVAPAKVIVPASQRVLGVAVSPDGKTVAADGEAGIVRRVNLASGRLDELTGHRSMVFRTRFAPDGQSFLSVSFDGTARVWDPSSRPPCACSPAIAARSETPNIRRAAIASSRRATTARCSRGPRVAPTSACCTRTRCRSARTRRSPGTITWSCTTARGW